MKRLVSILMALMLFAAPAIAQSTMLVGDWKLIYFVIEGVTYDNLAQQGLNVTMHLEADGTGVQTLNGDVYTCTWTEADGKIMIDDGDAPMAYALQPDGTLVGTDDAGDGMVFMRTGAATDSPVGAWKLFALQFRSVITYDMGTSGNELELTLNADGTGTLTTNDKEAACTWTQSDATITIVDENGESWIFTMQSDGTLYYVEDDVGLILSRTDIPATTAAPEPSQSAAIVSEYGFSVQLPEGWAALDSEYIANIAATFGEEIASANGFDQSLLDQLAAAEMSIYYAPDMSANFNVVRESAGYVTMDNFASLEPSYQASMSSQGITDFALSGPVDIGGKSYYVGTFTAQAGLDQKQYFCVANGYVYTITLTNVAEAAAEQIMGSFEIK